MASTTRCATSTRLTSSSSRTAAPASKRLISSRSASSVSNRSSSVCSSSAARAVAGSKSLAGVVQHVAGHPDGGQRRPQLVRDVGDEAALDPAELLELADLALQVRGHLVERRRQAGEVVLAGHPQPLGEPARREPLGDAAGQPHRRHDLPGDQPGHPGDQDQEQTARGDHGPGDQAHRLLLLVEGEQEVERVGPAVGGQRHLRADHDAGLGARRRRRRRPWCRSWCRSRRTRCAGRRSAPRAAGARWRGRDAGWPRCRRRAIRPASLPDRAGHHDLVAAGRAALDDQVARGRDAGRSGRARPGAASEPLVWPRRPRRRPRPATSSTRFSSRPSRVCCSSSQPTTADDHRGAAGPC